MGRNASACLNAWPVNAVVTVTVVFHKCIWFLAYMIIFNPQTTLVVEVTILLDKDPQAWVGQAPAELGAKLGFKPRSACPRASPLSIPVSEMGRNEV